MVTLAQAMAEEREKYARKDIKRGQHLLCTKCKHYFVEFYSYGSSGPPRCIHPAFYGPIDDCGVPVEYARLESKKCGPTGKLWEPVSRTKKSEGWFHRIFGG